MNTRLFLSLVVIPAILISCKTAPDVEEGSMFSLLPDDFPVIRVERGGFSPNGDGRFDTVDLIPEVGRQDRLQSWTVEIKNTDRETVREYKGQAPVPDRITWDGKIGLSSAADEGMYKAVFTADFGPDLSYLAETAPFVLRLEGPDIVLTIDDGAFSPDGDGIDDTYVMGISMEGSEPIESWEILIRDPEGTPFFLQKELGTPAEEWIWDGKGSSGTTALSGSDYGISLTVRDLWGNETVLDWQVHIDVLVISEGDRYIISLSRIIFKPYSDNFTDVEETARLTNERTLDQVAGILTKYSDYQVRLIGYGVHVYWNYPDAKKREQEKILLPLSLARATAIRNALVARGISEDRMSVEGRGGLEPVVPHSDLTNRWMNRRVVFYLIP